MAKNQYERDVEELFEKSEYTEQSEKTEKNTSDFFNGVDKGKSHITSRQISGILFMFSGLCFMLAAGLRYIIDKKTENVNKQVKAYEQTLPGYLEYKQAVEYYRDSLMYGIGK